MFEKLLLITDRFLDASPGIAHIHSFNLSHSRWLWILFDHATLNLNIFFCCYETLCTRVFVCIILHCSDRHIIYLIMLYIIVCSANILCIWNWALNWASFLIDRFVDSVISQLTACFHQKHNILVIFLYLEEKEKRKITVNIFLNAHTHTVVTNCQC